MDFFDVIRSRRSRRKFSDRPLDRQTLELVIDAALTAPSSKNCRSTRFMVVRDPEIIARMSLMRDSGSAFLAGAPAVIVVMGDTSLTDLWVDNCAISATVLQLAAEAVGLGSCWVHVNARPRVKNDPAAGNAEEYLRTLLPVPDNCNILCVAAIGYPDGNPQPRNAPDDSDKTTWL